MAAQPGRRVLDSLGGLSTDWVVLHDVAWPGRPHATIDHVLVGPSGIFVVLVRGPRRARERGRVPSGATSPASSAPSSAVAETSSAAAAVGGRVPFVPRHHVHAVLCSGDPAAPPEPEGDVMVVGATGLATTILAHPGSLPAEHTRALGSVLRSELASTVPPSRAGAGSGGPRAVGVRRVVARGALVAAALALLAVMSQPQLVGGLTSTDGASGSAATQASELDRDDPQGSDPAAGTGSGPESSPGTTSGPGYVEPTTPPATTGGDQGADDQGTDVEPVGEVEPSDETGTTGGSADARGQGGAGAGVGAGVGGAAGAGPAATDYRTLVGVLGPRDPAGIVSHVVRLVARGALPTDVGLRSTPVPGRLCLQDERRDVTVTVGGVARRDVLTFGRGSCETGTEVARLTGAAGDYTTAGDRRLARGVAALLTSG